MGQAIASANFFDITFNLTTSSQTGVLLPWGIQNAIQSATGLSATTNLNLTESVLNNMLSNFNPSNSTIQAIMSYPDQAYSISGPMTFVIHTLEPYSYLVQDLASGAGGGWWCDIVDPAFVDSHGGVQVDMPNTYFSSNSGPGTGPYLLTSIGTGFSDVVLTANPAYWGVNASNLPAVAQPAHITVIIVNFGLTENDALEDFATNQAQISYVNPPFFGELSSAYKFAPFNQVFRNFGLISSGFYWSMNTQRYPTNNTNFRLAVVHAINYSQMAAESYAFNGTSYGEAYLGPLNPAWGQYYNPGNLPLYSFDIPLAISYMNLAGMEEDFSLTLPNGTVIGNASAPALGPQTLYYLTPVTPVITTQFEIIQSGLTQIGLATALQGVTPALFLTYTTPQDTPDYFSASWGPDWPDPVLQQIYQLTTNVVDQPSWMNDSQVSTILNTLWYNTNSTQYINGIAQVYNDTYWYAPDIWLPAYDLYIFMQPYIHGFTYNLAVTPSVAYWYNMLYYGNG